ncbi:propionyl-CoA synthetase [Streptomyces sp. NTH33]|uniref:propionyl-CoA synthetase n=1 Tax=Streptomyces sp. NTH33 TaxID=1735453 RepID=UPI000DA830B8|nr:propionyl-CoA synthetase [Streptomyces sp. NTH33]PZH17803.1 propionyl-CoA synthetase [Streptomyces sp. NTH33]
MDVYRELHRRSIADPGTFWTEAAKAVTWDRDPVRVLDSDRPPFHRWFPDARINTCRNALDRHVEAGHGARTALIHDSPVTGTKSSLTYTELLDLTARFAGVLRGLGVGRGDRVIISMPMVPQAVVAMLACARLGAVHSVVFGGFAAKELAVRIDDARPKVVVSASCGVEAGRVVPYQPMLDEALRLARHTPERCVILQRPQAPADLTDRDLDWDEAMAAAEPADCVTVAATDPLYILYTSGTTGRPKGVVRDNGGHAVALAWSMRHIYGIGPGDVWWAASDVGWVVGHSYIVYAPLITGATTVVYEGKPVGTPDAGAFWRVIAEHGVKALFTAPTAIRAIKKQDPDAALLARHDLSGLRSLFLAGERLDTGTYSWATRALGVPVVDNWWQTETGWPITAVPRGVEGVDIRPGSPGVPMPGYDLRILDPSGHECAPGQDGAVTLRLPLPPGTLPTLWEDDERYVASYLSAYPGHYLTGDGGHVDEDGYVFVTGRTDDVVNVAGHRLSTGVMEEVVAAHPDVAECAVIAVRDELKGQVPRALVVLKSGADTTPDRLEREIVAEVRDQVGAVASLKQVTVVPALPKTRSGKILRAAMRDIADGRDTPTPATVEDPAVLHALRHTLRPED